MAVQSLLLQVGVMSLSIYITLRLATITYGLRSERDTERFSKPGGLDRRIKVGQPDCKCLHVSVPPVVAITCMPICVCTVSCAHVALHTSAAVFSQGAEVRNYYSTCSN